MNPITIISASAGSGKTYCLSEALKEAVSTGTARPEAVLATTFTRSAAAELQERVRQHLMREGRMHEARRLTAARMGTVNSVCGQLVTDYAFELGLSPNIGVLDENAASQILRRSLSAVLSADTEAKLSELNDRFGGWTWQQDVKTVVTFARTNDMNATSFTDFAKRSRQGYSELFDDASGSAPKLNQALLKALDEFLRGFDPDIDTTKVTSKVVQLVRSVRRVLSDGRTPRWSDWVKLARCEVGAKSRDLAPPVQAAAGAHDKHPQLQQDVHDAIDLVFSLAQKTIERYQLDKAELGVIDFIDQERFALQLLGDAAIQQQLSDQIDLVLVDEFQDTSPIQLAIFLKLAGIAKQNIWVGDQKQAIFGFRGTDPALMDAAIEQILGDQEPQTLDLSWRSRPPLVELTSNLFAPAFAHRGIPEHRVKLSPAKSEDPKELGHYIEHWSLEVKNQKLEAAALAAALQEMLLDPTVQVRDRITHQVRPVEARDIAVLGRTNNLCSQVAQALGDLGITAHLPRKGLLKTLEGQTLLAGLRLWADPADTLAAAELARLIEYPSDPNDWLTAIVRQPGPRAFAEQTSVKQINEARTSNPHAGPLAAFDSLVHLVKIDELCRRWGSGAARLANVEAFRGHVHQFVHLHQVAGGATTIAGLVTHLETLAGNDGDDQGTAGTENAVTICTWHKAKGLEWPITVLLGLKSRSFDLDALGAHMESDREQLDLADPLADRWIRYWPNPYGGMQKDVQLLDRLAAHLVTDSIRERGLKEQLRVLYVGWTRARDRVVLTSRPDQLCGGVLSLLNVDGDHPAVSEPDGSKWQWAGMKFETTVRNGQPLDAIDHIAVPESDYAEPIEQAWPPAYTQPSSVEASGSVGEPLILGPRLELDSTASWDKFGNAVHGFFAADRAQYPQNQRIELAGRQLEAWGATDLLTVDYVVAASDRFHVWVEGMWPGAVWKREWPIAMFDPSGSLIRGQVDLVIQHQDELIVMDHKSFPGTVDQAVERAAQYSGQLGLYQQMLEQAMGLRVTKCYIHMPIAGVVLPVTPTTKR